MTPFIITLVACAVISLGCGAYSMWDTYRWQRKRGFVVSAEEVALIRGAQSSPLKWEEFVNLPPYDPRYSWGARVHDLLDTEKTRVRALASALDKRNCELAAQTARANELMEDLDDAHREIEEARNSYVSPANHQGYAWSQAHGLPSWTITTTTDADMSAFLQNASSTTDPTGLDFNG